MESYLTSAHYDLVTPDGRITQLHAVGKQKSAHIRIENISAAFVGYKIDPQLITFNLKSTLAQLGLQAQNLHFELHPDTHSAEIEIEFLAIGHLGEATLNLLEVGMYVGKLFAADDRRRVRNPDYLMRMFGRCDRMGQPLLSLGGLEGSGDLILEKIEGRTVAFISLLDGIVTYNVDIYGLLPTIIKALRENMSQTRHLLHLNQQWEKEVPRLVHTNQMLLVKTTPLHIRTVYAHVVSSLLPQGVHHTSADYLQPDTAASGDIYELFGAGHQIIDDIPLEFYTLEPHREHVFFSDRDQLIASLEDPEAIFKAFTTAPEPHKAMAAVFVVKGSQMQALQKQDWIKREPQKYEFPGLAHPSRQALVAEKYLESNPSYPFLKAIEEGLITSQGVLLTRYFPTPLLKRMLLNDQVQTCLKRIYFQHPSSSFGDYFSHEDRALLIDLAKFGIPVFWADLASKQILQYTLKPEKEAGLFVPLTMVETFRRSTVIGVYGSNLLEGNFETELTLLLKGLLAMRSEMNHPLLSHDTPLALLTGGGPGAMEVGNRAAKSVGILSCANIVDFRDNKNSLVHEQKQNPYIDAKMTYRLDRLVERQAEFFLDLPIFLEGGIGMDFEYCLEEVRRKTGSCPSNPVLLFGDPNYWRRKITSRFQLNQQTGTTRGSEWVSNCFYCIQNATQGLHILRQFFQGTLPIGKGGPIYEDGFLAVTPAL